MAEFDEMNENMAAGEMVDAVAEEIEAEQVVEETPEVTEAAESGEAVSDETAETADEDATNPAEIDDELFDKVNRAARLLRNRKDALKEEAEEDAERLNNLVRALKLLELKPKMEQKEMSDLLGMRLRELNQILAQAEKQDIVARIVPEDEDMRKIVVYASEDAVAMAEAQGAKRKKLVPQLSAESAEQLLALLDQLIDPLTAMGLDTDARRGGRDDRRDDRRGGRDDRGRGGRGFGGRDDRRGGFGDRGGRGGRGGFGDRGGRGFGGRDDRRGGRDDRGRGGRGFGGRDDRRGGYRG